jgi:hypothetical protein
MGIEFRRDLEVFLREFVAARPGLRFGRMFGAPAGFAGRRMFACVAEDGILVNLPDDVARRELSRRATRFGRGGRSRTGWVFYRPKDRRAAARLAPTLEIAARHAAHRIVRQVG